MIGVIDYGMGNLRSVQKAFLHIGHEAEIIDEQTLRDSVALSKYSGIVLPGVGAFRDAIAIILEKGMDEPIKHEIDSGKPFLGICLGMQLLFDYSHENGRHKGLGVLPGEIVHLNVNAKIPHMGWNAIEKAQRPDVTEMGGVTLYENTSDGAYVYYDHSYCLETDADIVSAYTHYERRFPASVCKKNVFAMQFHPEKSGAIGLEMLNCFGALCKGAHDGGTK